MKKLGEFYCGGKMLCTDPCYDYDTSSETGINVEEGYYEAFISNVDKGMWGTRTQSLKVQNVAFKNELSKSKWEPITYCGVDAGLFGFFYQKPNYNDEEWITICNFLQKRREDKVGTECITSKDMPFKCQGVVSESGYGDGCYEVLAKKSNHTNRIIALKVKFI